MHGTRERIVMAERPWDPEPRETVEAYRAFRAFLELGDKRTLAGAGEALGKKLRTVEDYSKRFRWFDRAKAWDAWMARQYDDARAAETARRAKMTETRRQSQVEDDWALANALRTRAAEMLAWPIFTEEKLGVEGKTIVRTPAKWSMRDVVAMIRLSSELGRLALGMPTKAISIQDPAEERPNAILDSDVHVPPALAAQFREVASQYALNAIGAEAPAS